MGTGAYGELEGWLEWPAELYAVERTEPCAYICVTPPGLGSLVVDGGNLVGKEAHIAREIKALYSQDERLRTTGICFGDEGVIVETEVRVVESLKVRVAKMTEDEWMYSSTDTLYKRGTD